MNESHREIQQWLEKKFGGNVPEYEINGQTLEILGELMNYNERMEKACELRINDYSQKAEEYFSEAARLDNILQSLSLNKDTLSQSGMSSVKMLTLLTLALDINQPSNTNLLLGLSDQRDAFMKIKEERRREQKTLAILNTKTKASLQKCSTLQHALENLDKQVEFQGPELHKKAKQTGFLHTKATEYKNHISQLKGELDKHGVDGSVLHTNLLKKEEDLKALKEKLHPLTGKLDSYYKLPPDINLARVKLEEAKRELAALEAEFTSSINMLRS